MITKVISLYGSPGAGKSTAASWLFSKMKMEGKSVEIINETAKELIWASRNKCLNSQLYLLGHQSYKQEILIGQVEYIITDSPLLLSLIYTPKDYPLTFAPFLVDYNRRFNNINFFINRVKKYIPIGRNQTESESDRLGHSIKNLLDILGEKYLEVDGDLKGYETIAEKIL